MRNFFKINMILKYDFMSVSDNFQSNFKIDKERNNFLLNFMTDCLIYVAMRNILRRRCENLNTRSTLMPTVAVFQLYRGVN